MSKKVMIAKIPVILDCPEGLGPGLEQVLSGEYEFGYFGENLTILDIGANLGSFTVWANLRWPGSRIHAYEPSPEAFEILTVNVENLPNVTCHKLAVYPGEKESEPFWSRYAGDSAAGIAVHTSKIFKNLTRENVMEVPILHPRSLPEADIIKLDAEGAEAMILREANLQEVSLILLEYHSVENRDAIKELLRDDFALEYEDSIRWGLRLPSAEYKEEIEWDYQGRMFFANKRYNRLRLYRGREYM
jgi:FkbM family methyltransferase